MAQTNKQKVGEIGEDVACTFLEKHGYDIIDRNYRKKWGELDIVAKKDGVLHFVEVKSVSRVTEYNPKTDFKKSVRPTSYCHNWFRPEENVHPWKMKRLYRAIQTYLLEKVSDLPAEVLTEEGETNWQIDILAVFLDLNTRKAKFRLTENVIL
ncbi:MAG: YraN family protein [Candidatus Paceibacterota bacterium]